MDPSSPDDFETLLLAGFRADQANSILLARKLATAGSSEAQVTASLMGCGFPLEQATIIGRAAVNAAARARRGVTPPEDARIRGPDRTLFARWVRRVLIALGILIGVPFLILLGVGIYFAEPQNKREPVSGEQREAIRAPIEEIPHETGKLVFQDGKFRRITEGDADPIPEAHPAGRQALPPLRRTYRPIANAFLFRPDTTRTGSGVLTVVNGSGKNAICKLVNTANDAKVGTFVVLAGNNMEITAIPDFTGRVIFAFGDDIIEGSEMFAAPAGFFAFRDRFDFVTRRTGTGTTYSTFKITLQRVRGGNAPADGISAEEFNRY